MVKRSTESFQYLEFVKRTRQPRSTGELFYIKMKGMGYIPGRVVSVGCAITPEAFYDGEPIEVRKQAHLLHKQAHLIYIYNSVYDTAAFASPRDACNLLIPPVICLTGWSQGYFIPLRIEQPTEYKTLPVHCFFFGRYDYRKNQPYLEFCNEQGKRLSKCYTPYGSFGPYTHRGVEQLIAEAHGWPYIDK